MDREFITKLYEISTHSEGLTTLHKLKYEHVNLTSFNKLQITETF